MHHTGYIFFYSINMTSHPVPSVCGQARDKAELFRERYTILQQVSHLFQNVYVWQPGKTLLVSTFLIILETIGFFNATDLYLLNLLLTEVGKREVVNGQKLRFVNFFL